MFSMFFFSFCSISMCMFKCHSAVDEFIHLIFFMFFSFGWEGEGSFYWGWDIYCFFGLYMLKYKMILNICKNDKIQEKIIHSIEMWWFVVFFLFDLFAFCLLYLNIYYLYKCYHRACMCLYFTNSYVRFYVEEPKEVLLPTKEDWPNRTESSEKDIKSEK